MPANSPAQYAGCECERLLFVSYLVRALLFADAAAVAEFGIGIRLAELLDRALVARRFRSNVRARTERTFGII